MLLCKCIDPLLPSIITLVCKLKSTEYCDLYSAATCWAGCALCTATAPCKYHDWKFATKATCSYVQATWVKFKVILWHWQIGLWICNVFGHQFKYSAKMSIRHFDTSLHRTVCTPISVPFLNCMKILVVTPSRMNWIKMFKTIKFKYWIAWIYFRNPACL